MSSAALLRTATLFVIAVAASACSSSDQNNTRERLSETDCELCPDMTVIDAGEFLMGADETGAPDEEFDGPRHKVTFARPFAIARTEVTLGAYRRFAEETQRAASPCNIYEKDADWFISEERSWRNPGFEQGDDHPVVCVTWLDAAAYGAWLNEKTGKSYRLTSEAEWEYLGLAAAAGETDPYDRGNFGQMECCGPAEQGADEWRHTAAVGSTKADSNGLHDIRGNVWEWQADCFHINYHNAPSNGDAWTDECADETRHIVRGGSWGDGGEMIDPVYRLRAPEDQAYFTLGFRLAHDVD